MMRIFCLCFTLFITSFLVADFIEKTELEKKWQALYPEGSGNLALSQTRLLQFIEEKGDLGGIAIDLGASCPLNSFLLSSHFGHLLSVGLNVPHRSNVSVCDRRVCAVSESKDAITFKQLIYDYIISNEALPFQNISMIHCDLKGKEEEILDDLLYYAYNNKSNLSLILYPGSWSQKKWEDFEDLFRFFKIEQWNEEVDYVSLLLEPLPNLGVMRKQNMPAVVIAYNLLTCVRNMVQQLEKYTADIIVIDNNSDYQPLLDYYENDFKYTLVRLKSNRGPHIVFAPFISSLAGECYLLTDPDLIFHPRLPADFISTLFDLSNYFQSPRVGFALCIDAEDINENLILHHEDKNYTVREWESVFWKEPLHYPENSNLELYWGTIDTTFCLFNKRFIERDSHIRVAGNFTCLHAPWHTWFLNSLEEGEYAAYRRSNQSTTWKN